MPVWDAAEDSLLRFLRFRKIETHAFYPSDLRQFQNRNGFFVPTDMQRFFVPALNSAFPNTGSPSLVMQQEAAGSGKARVIVPEKPHSVYERKSNMPSLRLAAGLIRR